MSNESTNSVSANREPESNKTPKVLLRYTFLGNLLNMFEWGGIPLYDGSHWDDKCDYAFVLRGLREIKAKRIGILPCMAPDVNEGKEETIWETSAHWTCYSRKDEPKSLNDLGICIQFDGEKLLSLLNGKKIFNMAIDYLEYKKYRVPTSWEHHEPESWFFTKRNAFKWEHEYRIVIPDQPLCEIPVGALQDHASAFIPADDLSDVIQKVVFSPFCGKGTPCLRKEVLAFAKECFGKAGKSDVYESFSATIDGDKKAYCSRIFNNEDILDMANRPN